MLKVLSNRLHLRVDYLRSWRSLTIRTKTRAAMVASIIFRSLARTASMSSIWPFISSLWASQRFWEVVEIVGGAMVIVGAVIEAMAELLRVPKNRRLRRKVVVVSALTLIVGLMIELFGLFRTSEISDLTVAQLKSEAGAAAQRAAGAEKQTEDEKLVVAQLETRLAPRSFDTKLSQALNAALSKLSPQNVDIVEAGDSSDIASLAISLETCLSIPNWSVKIFEYSPDHTPYSAQIDKTNWLNTRAPEHTRAMIESLGVINDTFMRFLLHGVVIWAGDGANRSTDDVTIAIADALKKSGIDCFNVDGPLPGRAHSIRLPAVLTCRQYRTDLPLLYREPDKKTTIQITISPKE